MHLQPKTRVRYFMLPLVSIGLLLLSSCSIHIGDGAISPNHPKIRITKKHQFYAKGYWGRKGEKLPLKTALVQYMQSSRELEVYLYDFDLTAADRSQIAETQYIDEIHLQKPSHDPERDLHFRATLRIQFDPKVEQLTEDAIQRISVFSTGFLTSELSISATISFKLTLFP